MHSIKSVGELWTIVTTNENTFRLKMVAEKFFVRLLPPETVECNLIYERQHHRKRSTFCSHFTIIKKVNPEKNESPYHLSLLSFVGGPKQTSDGGWFREFSACKLCAFKENNKKCHLMAILFYLTISASVRKILLRRRSMFVVCNAQISCRDLNWSGRKIKKYHRRIIPTHANHSSGILIFFHWHQLRFLSIKEKEIPSGSGTYQHQQTHHLQRIACRLLTPFHLFSL